MRSRSSPRAAAFASPGPRSTDADLQLGLRETLPFTSGAGGSLRLNGRFTHAAGLGAFTSVLSGPDPSLRYGTLRVRLRTVARARVAWRAREGWDVRAPACVHLELRNVALRVMALDSVMITATGL